MDESAEGQTAPTPVEGPELTPEMAPRDAPQPPVAWAVPEPKPVPGRRQVVYADMPNRTIAYVVDLIVVIILGASVGAVIGALLAASGSATPLVNVVAGLIGAAISAWYFIYGWTRRRTLGMRMLGLQIGNAADGATLTIVQGVRRFVAVFGLSLLYELAAVTGLVTLTAVVGLVAFVWIVYLFISTATSPTKQGFHDRFAGSVVVKVTRAPV